MKKIILTLLIIVAACSNSINAQMQSNTDGFFKSESFEYRSTSDETLLPALPRIGTTENQKAPIGSGLAILTGLGLGYLTIKRKKKK